MREPAVAYLEGRGISRAVAERYKVTTVKDNDHILAFPFYDENNVLQFLKYRKTDFNRSRDKNKEWCERDTKPILFGMAQCVDFGRLVVTEGQLDSLSVAEAGIDNAVSVPNGCNGFTFLENVWDWIVRFDEVVVFGDCEGGKITLLDTLQKRLPNKVLAVQQADYLGEKDANDILRRYGAAAVQKAVENAKAPPVSHVKELADVQAVDLYTLPRIRTGLPELDRIIGGIGLEDPRVDGVMLEWSLDEDFWVRRVAIDHQLCRKERTNTALLEQIIVNNLGSGEFFINKAIGWSLRDYSKTNPAWVRDFLNRYGERMERLSVREAGKYV